MVVKALERMPQFSRYLKTRSNQLYKSNISTNKNKSTFRDIDKIFEEQCIKYLQERTSIIDDLKIEKYIDDTEIQQKGIDFIGYYHDKQINIDVKSIAQYDFPTFCFELMNINSGKKGWLIDENYMTDYYLLTYHQINDGTGSYKEDKKNLTCDNIINTRAILISRQKIKQIIDETINNMDLRCVIVEILNKSFYSKSMCPRFVYNPENNDFIESSDNDIIRFVYSKQIHEKPINIVIPRRILEQNADKIWNISHGLIS